MPATVEANLKTRLPKSLLRLGLNIASAELHQKRFNMIDDLAQPFVEINISTGEVKGYGGACKEAAQTRAQTVSAWRWSAG